MPIRPPPPNPRVLELPKGNIPSLFAGQDPLPPELPLAGQVSPCLAVTSDPVRGLLLTSSLDGSGGILRWYAMDGFRLRGSCRLDAPAYHMVLDAGGGQLWTATSVARVFTLGLLGDYENPIANIHLYDLGSMLESTGTPDATVKPVQVIKERSPSPVSEFLRSPDGRHLFYLTQLGSRAEVKRIDTRRRELDKEVSFRGGGLAALTQAPGGGKLYVLVGGQVHALDPNTMTSEPPLRIIGAPLSLCAGEGGKLFLSEYRQATIVHAIDWSGKEPKTLASWQADLDGRVYMRNSPDGRRIYLGNSAVLSGTVHGVEVSAPHLKRPALIGQALSTRERLLRGTLMVTPDGNFLVTGSGLVFRTPS
jgi:hypothetical protein